MARRTKNSKSGTYLAKSGGLLYIGLRKPRLRGSPCVAIYYRSMVI